jgi:hypothetical protein
MQISYFWSKSLPSAEGGENGKHPANRVRSGQSIELMMFVDGLAVRWMNERPSLAPFGLSDLSGDQELAVRCGSEIERRWGIRYDRAQTRNFN